MPKKKYELKFWLNRREQTRAELLPRLSFFGNGYDTFSFSFLMRAFIKKNENDYLLPLVGDLE